MERCLTFMLFALTITSGMAQEPIGFAPPTPPQEIRIQRPGPRHVWIPGYFQWNGTRYVWINGFWTIPPSSRSVWVPGRWEARNGMHVWVDGYWSPDLRR